MLKAWSVVLAVVLVAVESQDTVNAPGKPTLSVPNGLPYFKASSDFPLTCESDNVVNPLSYTFYKNGTSVLTQPQRTYYFYHPSRDHAGRYTCTVSNGTWVSDPSDGVDVIFLEIPSLTVNNKNPRIGDNLILTCSVPVQLPEFHFVWLNDSTEIGNGTEFIIDGVTTADVGDYSCVYMLRRTVGNLTYNLAGDSSKSFTVVFSAPVQPRLSYNDEHIQGQYISMLCAPPETSISRGVELASLYFGGKKIVETLASSSGGDFSQGQLLFRNAGSYACTLSNRIGESPLSRLVDVTVSAWSPGTAGLGREPDIFVRGSPGSAGLDRKTFIFGRGTYSYVTCTPDDFSFRIRFKIYYCTLFINGHRYLDEQGCNFQLPHAVTGSYSCSTASVNTTGVPGSTSAITFIDVPKIKPVSQQPLASNQNYSLQCDTDAPNSSIEWYKDNSPQEIASGVSILTINVQESLDGSSYRCRISDGQTEIWSDYYTLHLTSPTTPTLSGGSTGTKQPGLLLFTKALQFSCTGNNSQHYSLYKDGAQLVRDQTSANFLIFRSGKSGASYTCTTRNSIAESGHSQPVYVPGKDDIVLTASQPRAIIGQPLTLNCSVKNIMASNITHRWIVFRSNMLTTEINQQNLTFTPVTPSDIGLYICEIETELGKIRSNHYFPIITSPPNKPEVQDTDVGQPDSQVFDSSWPDDVYHRFVCTCKGIECDPNNPFRLYKNGLAVKDVEYRDLFNFLRTFTIQRFYIVNITAAENEGEYSCTAVNSIGESEHSAAVNISTTEYLVPRISADNPNATLGENITFTCAVPSTTFDYQVQWLKHSDSVLKSGRTLTLLSLDREDDGRYSCLYTNRTRIDSFGFIEKRSDHFYLVLREPLQPLLVFNNDEVEYTSKNFYRIGEVFFQFGEGDTVRFICQSQQAYYNIDSVVSENVATYTLFNNGQEVASSEARGDFNISGLALGTYNFTCKANNVIGDSPFSYPITVNIVARPVIEASTVSPAVGTNITLTCNTGYASDGSDVIWKKNGRILSWNSTDLALTELGRYDEGRYTCRQKIGSWHLPNSHEYTLSFRTQVATPEIFAVSPTTLDVGSPLQLYCLATSSASSKAVFYQNGRAVRTVDSQEYDSAGQLLYAYSVLYTTSDDAGSYACEVESGQGVPLVSEALIVTVAGCATDSSASSNSSDNNNSGSSNNSDNNYSGSYNNSGSHIAEGQKRQEK